MAKQKFFLVVPPGFEDLALRELQYRRVLDAPQLEFLLVQKIKGGLEFECEMDEGLRLNHLSRLGVRVLLRLFQFRCRGFPKLFNKVKNFPWRDFIQGPFDVEVAARRSRLMNKKRIAETVREGIAKSLGLKTTSTKAIEEAASTAPTQIFVRFQDDECQVSLDTSGEGLFKRGYKKLQAVAPLRENLAAGLFWHLYNGAEKPNAFALVDPLCGSGTFLSEAALFFAPLSRRDFDFQKWFKGGALRTDLADRAPTFTLFGFDRNAQAVTWARENLLNVNLPQTSHVVLEQRDFLDSDDRSRLLNSEIVQNLDEDLVRLGLANPPYGERIRLPLPPKDFYRELADFFVAFQCRAFGFIVPRKYLRYAPKPDHTLNFSNGGLPVTFVMYQNR